MGFHSVGANISRSRPLSIGLSVAAVASSLLLSACGSDGTGGAQIVPGTVTPTPTPPPTPPPQVSGVTTATVATFTDPWAMEFLSDGRFLVSERAKTTQSAGRLWLVAQNGAKIEVSGLPANLGVLDIKLDPSFGSNGIIYVSFLEEALADEPRVGRNAADMSRVPEGLAVFRAKLVATNQSAKVETLSVIWRQAPKVVSHAGSGEPGGHITFSPDGRFLFIAAGDRQEFEPVQDLGTTLGKVVRIYPDGTIPTDNPFAGRSGAKLEIWSLGHRNPYGLAFDERGQLWEHEMGPKGGDEFNKIVRAAIMAGRSFPTANIMTRTATTSRIMHRATGSSRRISAGPPSFLRRV